MCRIGTDSFLITLLFEMVHFEMLFMFILLYFLYEAIKMRRLFTNVTSSKSKQPLSLSSSIQSHVIGPALLSCLSLPVISPCRFMSNNSYASGLISLLPVIIKYLACVSLLRLPLLKVEKQIVCPGVSSAPHYTTSSSNCSLET